VVFSGVSLDRAVAQLQIRLQIANPHAGTICVTQPRGQASCKQIAAALVAAMNRVGISARLVTDPGETETGSPAAEGSGTASPTTSRSTDGCRVIASGDLLDSLDSLRGAASADLTVLVARRGRTRRADVDEARQSLESVGARLAAAVLLD